MQIDEQTRHEVFSTLVEKLGQTTAVVLMKSVPPSAWSEYPTRAEIATMLAGVEDRSSARLYRALFIQSMALLAANVALITAMAN